MKRLLLAAVLFAALQTLPTQADFFQCVASMLCTGTPIADLMNGSAGNDLMNGQAGNDLMFGGDGDDDMSGSDGDDQIFGGNGVDDLTGNLGNDTLLPGPDVDANSEQVASGSGGNDRFIVFAGEIFGCLTVFGGTGVDEANLIGFGPYSTQKPFGLSNFGDGYVLITDPITNGIIAIYVSEDDDGGIEVINGLSSPNVTIVDEVPEGCTD